LKIGREKIKEVSSGYFQGFGLFYFWFPYNITKCEKRQEIFIVFYIKGREVAA